MARITVYSTDNCSFCTRAKALLEARGLSYEEVNLDRAPDGRTQLIERTGMMSFPQVIVGDQVLGGWAELVDADRTGRLRALAGA